ncbi:sensory rhodopsin transducer [Cellulomonas bogoriensis]|uniref:Sensory rhodopsin transducer n=1 Tax=Cellulomonas bogoriensis 69B4 = DSM 16987 TaxID=1386082 RepID=A0A0A0BML8_9CELL|nr:sensory rhodopsin transducer [Cellulomonas bogoriensis]KGM08962.1 hypothetical protein N869_08655 [Cellulomonas bogoriensis 69B4 = DSM 16987]
MSDTALGHRTWVFSGGNIPPRSTGPEPEMTSRDELCLANTGPVTTEVQVTVLFEDRDPVGPHRLSVPGQRVRHVRVNDLIDPYPVPLGVPYGLVVRSEEPVVAQLTRLDTRDGQLATAVAAGTPVLG